MSEFEPRVTKGLYGTVQDDRLIPRELLKERIYRKIAQAISVTGFFRNYVKRPVFIVGSARSGTSILLQNIDAHKDVAIFPGEALDLWFPGAFPWRLSDLSLPPYWRDAPTYVEGVLSRWTDVHTKKLKSTFGFFHRLMGKKVFINKQAMSALILPHMHRLFPDALFVHIYRDGRDVAFSYAEQEYARMQLYPEAYRKGGHQYSFEQMLLFCSQLWEEQMSEIERVKREERIFSASNFLEISYEQFCDNPLEVNQKIADFIAVSKDFNNLPSVSQSKKRYEQQLSSSEIEKMEEIMGNSLRLKGYL